MCTYSYKHQTVVRLGLLFFSKSPESLLCSIVPSVSTPPRMCLDGERRLQKWGPEVVNEEHVTEAWQRLFPVNSCNTLINTFIRARNRFQCCLLLQLPSTALFLLVTTMFIASLPIGWLARDYPQEYMGIRHICVPDIIRDELCHCRAFNAQPVDDGPECIGRY